MFRSPVCISYRLLNGLVPRSRVSWPADDMTKFASGCLHMVHRDHHRHVQTADTHIYSSTRCLPHDFLNSPTLTRLSTLTCCQPGLSLVHVSNYSTSQDNKSNPPKEETNPEAVNVAANTGEEKLSIFQRFKRAYKEHGKILVGVHVATSIVWYGSFYAAARGGIDIVPYLEQWGLSETIIKPFRAGGLGDFALAYLMYKLATPARYTVTLAGTNLVIRRLRTKGYMAPKSQEDSLRKLYKDGRQQLADSNLRRERLEKLKTARAKRKSEKHKKK